jgi:hypothetical protein
MRTTLTAAALVASLAVPSAAFAQRFPFERTLEAAGTDTLDVSTVRANIDYGETTRHEKKDAVTERTQ